MTGRGRLAGQGLLSQQKSLHAEYLAMPVADWLAAHDVASLAPKFDEEGVETLEDLLAVVQAEGDLKYLGVDAAQAAQLWPAIQAVK